MLRIVQLPTAAAAKQYLAASDYYRDGGEQPGVIGGDGARRLGLVPGADVTQEQFDRLCDNRHPLTGRQLTAHLKSNRRVGWDMNFHAPKGVTLLAELLGDRRVVDAHDSAVRAAMGRIEADMKTRVRVGGGTGDRVTGNAVYSLHTHFDARPVGGVPDPHLHTHAAVWNATYDPVEDKWKACEIAEIKRDAGFYEAVYHAELARGVAALGYGVERRGRFWDVAGMPDGVLRKFSRRTAVVEAAAVARGVTDPARKGELGARTREKKQPGRTPAALKEEWVSRLTEEERVALGSLQGRTTPPPATAAAAMDYAVRHLFERSSVVPEKAVYEEALRFGVGVVGLEDLRAEAGGHGLVVRGGLSTTRRALATEARLIAYARDGRGACRPLGAGGSGKSDSSVRLNRGQKAAVAHILASRDRIVLVRGAAGTGKTTLLRTAVATIDRPVRAVGVTSTAADELAREVTPNASTLARFLLDEAMQDGVRDGVVLVDEAGLVGTRQMDRLLGVLERVDARAVLVGDARQHAAVEAGSPFRALQRHAGLPVAEVTEVVRQAGNYRVVSERLSAGDTDAALDMLDRLGWVTTGDADARSRAVAADYLDEVHAGRSVLVVCPTHAEGEAVTADLRAALRTAGALRGEDRVVTRLVPLHLTEAQAGDAVPDGAVVQFHRAKGRFKAGERVVVTEGGVDLSAAAGAFAAYRPEPLPLAVGDAVRVTAAGKDRSGRHRLVTGSTYRVAGFTRGGDVRLDNGWVLDKGFGHLAHGYVATSHASQGRTVDAVLVVESAASFPAAGREQLYVSLSRGRTQARLYTDSLADLRDAVRRDRGQANAHDLVGPPAGGHRVRVVSLAQERAKRIAAAAGRAVRQVGRLTRRREGAYDYDVG